MSTQQYVEVSIYTLNESIATEDFLAKSNEVEAFFSTLDGFDRRELMTNDNGQWVDLTYWSTKAQAKSAEPLIYESPLVEEVMQMLNEDDMVFTHVSPVK